MSFMDGRRGRRRQIAWTRSRILSIVTFAAFWVLVSLNQGWANLLAWLLILAAVVRVGVWVRGRWRAGWRPRHRKQQPVSEDGFVLGEMAAAGMCRC